MCDEEAKPSTSTSTKKRRPDEAKTPKQTAKKPRTAASSTGKPKKRKNSLAGVDDGNDSAKSAKASGKKKKKKSPETDAIALRNDAGDDEFHDNGGALFEPIAVVDDDDEEADANSCESPLGEKRPDANVRALPPKRTDFFSTVIDEIALEGLDGITLEALWLRLSIVLEDVLPLDRCVQLHAWSVIVRGLATDCFRAYELKEPRPKLVLYNRFEHINAEPESRRVPQEVPEDIYPYKPILDQENDVIGSCVQYNERSDVTLAVKCLTLDEAAAKYGNKLTIVADQKLRNLALFDEYAASNVKLSEQEYCLLERIGRSRRLGEATAGTLSMQTLCKDPKTLFYYRKLLIKTKLIQKQSVFMKVNNQAFNAGLCNLPRFYTEVKTKKQLIIEDIVQMLKKRDKFRMEYAELRLAYKRLWEKMNVQKILKSIEARQYIQSKLLLYREVYPDATESEYKSKKIEERNVRVLELTDPHVNVSAMWKEEDQKDESSDEDTSGYVSLSSPLAHQCYKMILNVGSDGMSIKELQVKTGLDFYTVRAIVLNLQRAAIIDSFFVDIGRLHVAKYYAKIASYPDHYARRMAEKKATDRQFEQCDDEALQHIASTLGVDVGDLRKEPRAKREPFDVADEANVYDAIARSRRDGAKRNASATDLDAIYKNEHEYRVALPNYCRRFRLNDGGKRNADHQKVCLELMRYEGGPTIAPNPFHAECVTPLPENRAKKSNAAPKLEHRLRRCDDNETLTAAMLKMCLTNATMQNRCCEDTIRVANGYLQYLESFDKVTADFNYPDDLRSDDEDKEESIGDNNLITVKHLIVENDLIDAEEDLIAERGSSCGGIDERQKVQKSAIAVAELIAKFENPLASSEEPRPCCLNPDDRLEIAVDAKEKAESSFTSNNEQMSEADVKDVEKCELRKIQSEDTKPEECKSEKREPEYVESSAKEEPLETKETPAPSTSSSDVKSGIESTIVDAHLGPKPRLLDRYVDKTGITVEKYESSSPADIDFNYAAIERQIRFKNRSQLISAYVEEAKYVTDLKTLYNLIADAETKEGSVYTLDRRSLTRILLYLMKIERIKIRKTIVSLNGVTRHKYICHVRDYDVTDVIAATLEELKSNLSSGTTRKGNVPRRKIAYKMINVVTKGYGYLAKFPRLRLLHEYLFYLAYGYGRSQNATVVDTVDVAGYLKSKYDVAVDEDFDAELSPVYGDRLDWRLFVPPLHGTVTASTPGWLLISDVFAAMPLSVYVKLFSISFYIPELITTYLNHPIRRHVLVKHLPLRLRDAFYYRRKCLFAMHEMITLLCYMGLVQIGTQVQRLRDQFYVYLNLNAIIYDTMSSEPSYHKITPRDDYPLMRFNFDTMQSIQDYWQKLCNVALHSKLGRKVQQLGTYVTIENVFAKSAMVEAAKSVTYEEAVAKDVGYVPGDRSGAACLDSAIWVHVKRNWGWTRHVQTNAIAGAKSFRKKHADKAVAKPVKFKELLKRRRQANNGTTTAIANGKKSAGKRAKASAKSSTAVKNKKAKIVRQIVHTARKKQIVYYDEVDRQLKVRYGKTRAVWSHDEDVALLLCHNVFNYLCVYVQRKFLSYTIIRDVLHALLPQKGMKMSRAYQRRLKKIRSRLSRTEFYDGANSIQLSDIYDIHKYFKSFRLKLRTREYGEKELNVAFLYATWLAYNYLKSHAACVGKEEKDYGQLLTGDALERLESLRFGDVDGASKGKRNCYATEPCDEEAIIDSVIKSLILNTLNSNVSNSIVNLFNTYQKFPEPLLRSALNWLKRHQLIVHNKSRHERKGLQVTGRVYGLSLSYYQKQITQLPHNVFDAAREYCRGIEWKTSESSDDRPELSIERFNQGHGIAMNEHHVRSRLHFRFRMDDDVLRMNPNVTDYANLINELVKRYTRIMCRKSPEDERYMAKLIPAEIGGNDADVRDYIESIIAESSLANERQQRRPTGDSSRKRKWKLSDLAMLLSKGLFPDLDDERKLEELNNCFTVVHPTPTMIVDADTYRFPVNNSYESVLDDIRSECHVDTAEIDDEEVARRFVAKGANESDLSLVHEVIGLIRNGTHLGATVDVLKTLYSVEGTNIDLLTVIETLLELRVIYKMGVARFHFVHRSFVEPWTLAVEGSATSDGASRRVKITPWVGFDGAINDGLLQNWFRVVLSHCVRYPTVPLDHLFVRFDYLKPVDMYAIVQYLKKLNCFELYKCQRVERRVTLFSGYESVPELLEGKDRNVTVLDEFETIHVETLPTAVTALSNAIRGYKDETGDDKTLFD